MKNTKNIQTSSYALHASSHAKPFIKWVGGKGQLILIIIRLFVNILVALWDN
jgi:hypothetical protein